MVKPTTAGDRAAGKWHLLGLALSFLVPFVVYVATLAPTINFEDPVEFALGAATLGVDHPSGYPLETHLGHLFTHLPVGGVPWRINLSSAFCGALAAAFIFLLTWELLAPAVKERRLLAAGAWAAGGLFAFSYTFWPQAVITEVYALNAALFAATLWCGARCRARGEARWFYMTAFAASLAAANHPLSLAATVPLLAYLWFKLRRGAGGKALVANAALFLLFGVSIYLYLALRASREPPLNWGAPADLPRFLDHIRRREFGTIFWPRYKYLGYHALELGKLLLFQFGPGPGILSAVGLVWLLRSRVPYAPPLAMLAAVTGPATTLTLVGLLTPFQVFEIEVWYLSFFLICAPFAAGVVVMGLNRIKKPALTVAAASALALLPVYPALFHARQANHRGHYFPLENGRNRLRTFAYRSLVAFPYYGRQGLFAQSYLRAEEGRRPDLIVVDPRNAVLSELPSARRGPRFIVDPDAAETWWLSFRQDLLGANPDRPFYYNVDDANSARGGISLEPFGLLYRRRRPLPGDGRPGAPWDRYEYTAFRVVGKRLRAGGATYDPTTLRVYANYYIMAAEYCFNLGREETAFRNLAAAEIAATRDPHIGLLLASFYNNHGRPEIAIPLFLECLPALEHFRDDSLMFRREYAFTLNGLAQAYLRTGDVETAQRYFEESLEVNPEQTELAANLSAETLAAAAAEFREHNR